MRPRQNVSHGLQLLPTITVHGAGGPKNTVQIEAYGLRCAQHVPCLSMLQGYILLRRIAHISPLLILRGWLYSCVGRSVNQRLVHVS